MGGVGGYQAIVPSSHCAFELLDLVPNLPNVLPFVGTYQFYQLQANCALSLSPRDWLEGDRFRYGSQIYQIFCHLWVCTNFTNCKPIVPVCMILPGGGYGLQTCRGLAAQWFDSPLYTMGEGYLS